jgi:hypothetical protein
MQMVAEVGGVAAARQLVRAGTRPMALPSLAVALRGVIASLDSLALVEPDEVNVKSAAKGALRTARRKGS